MSERQDREPIAIVGMGCRLPGARDVRAFWQLLLDGGDAIREIPQDRLDVAALFAAAPATPGHIMTRWAGVLDDLDQFDAQFFGIAPREAELVDPQQRLLLEVSWEALEDAGIPAAVLDESDTGVFVGLWLNEYESRMFRDAAEIDFYKTLGTGRYSASGRLSYFYGMRGPSITVDTACSSSLVAVHLACRSLWSGECQTALAGGANTILEPFITIAYSQSKMMAPDGRCKFGDARGDGYVRSDGAGMVVLKRLSDAVASGDPIYAVIRGGAVNNDGRGSGFLATPAQDGQVDLLRKAYRDAGVLPGLVQYVEAHGTGTFAGDPVEIQALGEVLRDGRPAGGVCRLGSVKTNIGHTESAAGVVGLMKVALALQHGVIPKSLHCLEPNPRIPWQALPVEVQRETSPWPGGHRSAIAGVSAFGISGTNAHVVLQAYECESALAAVDPDRQRRFLLPISAKSEAALRELAGSFAADLPDRAATFGDVCFTAALRRTHHSYRVTVASRDASDAAEQLQAFVDGESRPGLSTGLVSSQPRKVAFVFPGQGSQWLGMGRGLMASEPVFRQALDRADAAVRELTGWSVVEELQAGEDRSNLARIDVVQPVLFSIQVALAALWRSWGIEPEAVIGHSMGEVAAAHVAGALSLEDAARIICRRSMLLRRTSGQGAMAVVELSLVDAARAIEGFEDRLSVAVSNSSRSTVLSGDPAALDEVLAALESRSVFCRKIKVDVASHSPQMDPLRDDLLRAIREIAPLPAPLTFCSTVVGHDIAGTQLTPDYWSRNLREPVLFSTALRALLEAGFDSFVEMSPHPLLIGAVQEVAAEAGRSAISLPSGRRDEDEPSVMLSSLGALHCAGARVAWPALFGSSGGVVALPHYPWQRERFWYDVPVNSVAGRSAADDVLGAALEPSQQAGAWYWQFDVSLASLPYLADHRVRTSVVVPAAFYIALAAESVRRVLGDGLMTVDGLRIGQGLVVPAEGARAVQVVLSVEGTRAGAVRILSRTAGMEADAWTEHAVAHVTLTDASPSAPINLPEMPASAEPLTAAGHYEAMSGRGLEYGPAFHVVGDGWRHAHERRVRLRVPPAPATAAGTLQLRTQALDGCLQAVLAALPGPSDGVDRGDTYVPIAIDAIAFHGSIANGAEYWCHVTAGAHRSDGTFSGDVRLLDDGGAGVIDVRGVQFQCIERERDARARDAMHSAIWRSATPVAATSAPGAWLLVEDGDGTRDLASAMKARGAAVSVRPLSDLREALREGQYRGVVCRVDEPGADACDAAARALASKAMRAAQAVIAAELSKPPRLWFVTSGAQQALAAEPVNGIASAVLWGLRSVVAAEFPGLACTAIDIGARSDAREMTALVNELLDDGREYEVALRGSERFVRRLRRGVTEEPTAPTPSHGRPYRGVTRSPGVLDGLVFETMARRAPVGREVEIEIVATGLNFMNVMSALGVYPGAPRGVGPLGIECTGRVVRVGPDVTRFEPGAEVMAFAHDSLASHAVVDERLVSAIPSGLDFEAAATIPIAFLTAHYALVHLGRIAPGERVLIHSAAGGVGLAAIQIAQQAGAVVSATAGTEEKRELLRSLGVAHVADSRSSGWAAAIRQATGGEGVDLVLNSLAGEAIPAGLGLLRSGGRFLEIGKRDIYENRALGLLPFQRNLSYFAIDLDRLAREKPELVGSMLDALARDFRASGFAPLPRQTYPARETVDAFRRMAQGTHTGKIVITADRESVPVHPRLDGRPRDWAAGTYLVTGGGSGLGLEAARWMTSEGARSIVLMGRREESAALAATLQPLRASGVTIDVIAGDVGSPDDVARVLAHIDANRAALGGIIHAAGVLDDATLPQMDDEKLARVFAPKVSGAWNLHVATRDRSLDFFVLYSSVTSFIGSAGQGNYAAANAWLDALAAHRRASGLPASSINWGPWSEIGLAAARTDRGARLASRGLGELAPSTGIAALADLLRVNPVSAAVMPFDARQWCDSAGTAPWPLFGDLLSDPALEAAPERPASLREQLSLTPPGRRRRALLEGFVQQTVAQVLKLAPSRVDLARPLRTLGLDSLMGLELRNRLDGATGLSLPATLVWNYPTVSQMTVELAARMNIELEDGSPNAADASVTPDRAGDSTDLETMLAELEGLSDEDARRLLADGV